MSFLKADYRIVCEGAEYKEIERNARVAVLMYPVGIPLMYLLLLIAARQAIVKERPTRLSAALSFLHRDFVARLYWCDIDRLLARPPPTTSTHHASPLAHPHASSPL